MPTNLPSTSRESLCVGRGKAPRAGDTVLDVPEAAYAHGEGGPERPTPPPPGFNNMR